MKKKSLKYLTENHSPLPLFILLLHIRIKKLIYEMALDRPRQYGARVVKAVIGG